MSHLFIKELEGYLAILFQLPFLNCAGNLSLRTPFLLYSPSDTAQVLELVHHLEALPRVSPLPEQLNTLPLRRQNVEDYLEQYLCCLKALIQHDKIL
jgi:hypothetical protein